MCCRHDTAANWPISAVTTVAAARDSFDAGVASGATKRTRSGIHFTHNGGQGLIVCEYETLTETTQTTVGRRRTVGQTQRGEARLQLVAFGEPQLVVQLNGSGRGGFDRVQLRVGDHVHVVQRLQRDDARE